VDSSMGTKIGQAVRRSGIAMYGEIFMVVFLKQ
jgi:hypothetical protein